MKGLLKNLGLIIIVVAAAIMIALHFTENVNNNLLTGGVFVLMLAGLISYIAINKRLED